MADMPLTGLGGTPRLRETVVRGAAGTGGSQAEYSAEPPFDVVHQGSWQVADG